MPSEPVEQVAIEELVLRLPGVSRGEAPALAEAILRRVQDQLRGSRRAGRLHLAELTIRVPSGLGREQLVAAIADRITEVMS